MPVGVLPVQLLVLAIQLQDECFSLLPVAKSCGRIEVTDIAQIEQFGAPAFCHAGDRRQRGKVIVGACGHDAAKWQRA